MPKFNDFDQIVNNTLSKSVVVAPSDPNGGAKLPERQENKAKNKEKEGQYKAVFDREYKESNDQLDDWMKDTNALTGSSEKFVNDEDDYTWADDPDKDSRGTETYDALSDDNPEGDVKMRKSHEAEEEKDEIEEDEKDEKRDKEEMKKDKEDKEKERKKEVRKALGKDASDFVDASPLVKSLIDAIMDWRDQVTTETRALHSRINHLEKALRSENRQMTKSLAVGMSQLSVPQAPVEQFTDYQQSSHQQPMQPMRKGYGVAPATTQKFERGFDLAKSLDVLDQAFQDPATGVTLRDVTILENDKSPQYLSNAAISVLKKNGCL